MVERVMSCLGPQFPRWPSDTLNSSLTDQGANCKVLSAMRRSGESHPRLQAPGFGFVHIMCSLSPKPAFPEVWHLGHCCDPS